MKVKQLLALTYEGIPKQKVSDICGTMMKELGFKCAGTPYYLKDALTSIQNPISNELRLGKITEADDLVLKGNFICCNSHKINELSYDYLKELFTAIKKVH